MNNPFNIFCNKGVLLMKKLHIAFVTAATLAIAPLALAKNAPNDPLATVVPEGCSTVQIAPFGTSLLASWSWEEGTIQTKFGGDAVYLVTVSGDGGTIWTDPFEVEFELVQYEPDTAADEYPGQLVYRCSIAQTDPAGSCNGSVLGLRTAVLNAAIDETGFTAVDIGRNIQASLVGVNVKAMNPGKDNGRQKYPLVNVCDVPL